MSAVESPTLQSSFRIKKEQKEEGCFEDFFTAALQKQQEVVLTDKQWVEAYLKNSPPKADFYKIRSPTFHKFPTTYKDALDIYQTWHTQAKSASDTVIHFSILYSVAYALHKDKIDPSSVSEFVKFLGSIHCLKAVCKHLVSIRDQDEDEDDITIIFTLPSPWNKLRHTAKYLLTCQSWFFYCMQTFSCNSGSAMQQASKLLLKSLSTCSFDCKPLYQACVVDQKDAITSLVNLHAFFQPKDGVAFKRVWSKLHNLRLKKNQAPTLYDAEVKQSVEDFHLFFPGIPNDDLLKFRRHLFFLGLECWTSLDSLVDGLISRGKDMPLSEIVHVLTQKIGTGTLRNPPTASVAQATKSTNRNKQFKRKTRPCSGCGKEDHRTSDCQLFKNKQTSTDFCFICLARDHRSRQCPQRNKPISHKCSHCHKSDIHFSKNCPKNPVNKKAFGLIAVASPAKKKSVSPPLSPAAVSSASAPNASAQCVNVDSATPSWTSNCFSFLAAQSTTKDSKAMPQSTAPHQPPLTLSSTLQALSDSDYTDQVRKDLKRLKIDPKDVFLDAPEHPQLLDMFNDDEEETQAYLDDLRKLPYFQSLQHGGPTCTNSL